MPKLIWTCCQRKSDESYQECQTGKCGLSQEFEVVLDMNDDNYVTFVQEYFKKNLATEKMLKDFKNPTDHR